MLEEDLTIADGSERSGATAEGALAGLLRCGVDSLPASVACRQVWTSHPAVVPHVEVPSGQKIKRSGLTKKTRRLQATYILLHFANILLLGVPVKLADMPLVVLFCF